MNKILIPAQGTVWFTVWAELREEDGPDLVIDGPCEWRRPVVALIEVARYNSGRRGEDGQVAAWGQDAPFEPVVVDETGNLFEAYDYLEQLMGGSHWHHTAHIYQPHIDAPIGDAPRIRKVRAQDADPFSLENLRADAMSDVERTESESGEVASRSGNEF